MTVNAKLTALFGGSAGNHTLGAQLKEAGVSIASGAFTFDTTQAHRLQPTGWVGAGEPTQPTGYTKLCSGWSFLFTRSSGTIDASHKIVSAARFTGDDPDQMTMREETDGKLTFVIAGQTVGTYTPTGEHHIIMLASRASDNNAAWAGDDAVWATVIVDKTVIINTTVLATRDGSPQRGAPVFGESAAIGASANSFIVKQFAQFYTDRSNPIGKITVGQWTWRLGITPPVNNDQGTKSTGTDGAALIDEVPPGGSGTTDGDYYDVNNAATAQWQVNALAQNILSAGDVLYAVIVKPWERTATTDKLAGIGAALHDGTNRVGIGGNALTGPTSYAETIFGNEGCAIWNTAPDATAWSGKANAYLNGCFAGTEAPGTNTSANNRVDAIIVETGIVLSADTISALSDPPTATRRIFVT